eukprot:3031770-Amphidinium_carterae.1
MDSLVLVAGMVEQKVIKDNGETLTDYVVVLDLAPVHVSQDFLARFAGEHPSGHLVFMPARMTSVCQPLDIACMRSFKARPLAAASHNCAVQS